jgi:hypothetical protein
MMRQFLLLLILVSLQLTIVAQKKAPKIPLDTLPTVEHKATFLYTKNWIDSAASPQKTGVAFAKKRNDTNFYIVLGVLLFFGLMNVVFSKYIKELWIISFKSSFRTGGLKAQLSANLLASLVSNIFFCLTIGLFLFIITRWQQVIIVHNQWLQLLICIVAVAILYIVKFLSLQFLGVLFQQKKLMEDYIFIVFLSNKLIGMILLPVVCFLLINQFWEQPIIVLTTCIIVTLIIYRYLISYVAVGKRLEISKFHFFIYLCSAELLPLLILFKVLKNNM